MPFKGGSTWAGVGTRGNWVSLVGQEHDADQAYKVGVMDWRWDVEKVSG